MRNRKIQIGVIGDSQIQSQKQYDIAYNIGVEISRVGAILICGGRGGVMEAACKGVFDEGGISVGILPFDNLDPEINKYLTIRIPTNLGWTRNSLVPLASDGVIACGGGVGTLSELAFTALTHKPLICIVEIPGWSDKIGQAGYIDLKEKYEKLFATTSGKEAVTYLVEQILATQ